MARCRTRTCSRRKLAEALGEASGGSLSNHVVGSLLGACFGLQSLPGLYTLLGTPVLFAGLGMIMTGEQRRVKARILSQKDPTSEDIEIEFK